MRAVAEEAGVSVETVYLHFRSKPTLLRALLESALGADDDPAPVSERVWVKEVAAQPTARSGIVAFSKAIGTVHAELAPLFIAVRAAAEADTGAAQIWAARTTERLHGMAAFADRLMATGEVRPEATAQDTRDRLFALASPELYGLLVLELHWSPDRYTDWLAETLTQQLLPTAPECVDQAQAAPRTTPGG
jgi:AcrR family transcriptional regulator